MSDFVVTYTDGSSERLPNITDWTVSNEWIASSVYGAISSSDLKAPLAMPRLKAQRGDKTVRVFMLHAVRSYGFAEED